MVRKVTVFMVWLAAAGVLCGVPLRSSAEDTAKKEEKAAEEKQTKAEKSKNNDKSFRDGINRAYDGFKKEMDKGKKNLNDLYEREKEKSGK